jgi:hypothetical protein
LRAPFLLRVVKAGLEEDVRQEWIIHLHKQACRDNRAILLVQFTCQRLKVFFVRLVILVDADA